MSSPLLPLYRRQGLGAAIFTQHLGTFRVCFEVSLPSVVVVVVVVFVFVVFVVAVVVVVVAVVVVVVVVVVGVVVVVATASVCFAFIVVHIHMRCDTDAGGFVLKQMGQNSIFVFVMVYVS